MDIQMLHGTKVEKRRSPVNYSSTSTNCAGRACAAAADSRFHPPGGLNKNIRPNARASAGYRSLSRFRDAKCQ